MVNAMQPIAPDEKILLSLMKAGDEKAFTLLYHQHRDRLYGNILIMVKDEVASEEMVQEVFAHIWQVRERLNVESNFAAYLAKAGRNRVLDFYRKVKRDRKLFERFCRTVTSGSGNLHCELDSREWQLYLDKVIEGLPGQQRKAYRLCKQEGMSYKEAADSMGISPYTVKEYLDNARAYLKKYLHTSLAE